MDFTSAIVWSPAAEQNAAGNASEDWEEPNSYLSRLWNHPGGAPDILGLGGVPPSRHNVSKAGPEQVTTRWPGTRGQGSCGQGQHP